MTTGFGFNDGKQYDYVHPDLLAKARAWAKKELDERGLDAYLTFKRQPGSSSAKNPEEGVRNWPIPGGARGIPCKPRKPARNQEKRRVEVPSISPLNSEDEATVDSSSDSD